jgi:hypothetical protein
VASNSTDRFSKSNSVDQMGRREGRVDEMPQKRLNPLFRRDGYTACCV